MKVAVLYSGLVRLSKEETLDNIKRAKLCFPNADFYFGAWKTDEKAYELDIIDIFFDEPKFKYNPVNTMIRGNIIHLNWQKNNNSCKEDIEYTLNLIKEQLKVRWKYRKNNNQHCHHALMVRRFIDSSYDIVVRLRYDSIIALDFADKSNFFIQECYTNKHPIGFASNFDISGESEIEDNGWSDQDVLYDCMIIHRQDMFDPDLTFELLFKHKLQFGETGWTQLLCDPYNIKNKKNIAYHGFVKIKQ